LTWIVAKKREPGPKGTVRVPNIKPERAFLF
jgi:hypothetical protein